MSFEFAPLHERRPDYIHYLISGAVQSDLPPSDHDYIFRGEYRDYRFSKSNQISALAVATEMAKNKARPLRVLDIGAGAGAFVWACQKRGHHADALSVHDFSKESKIPGLLRPGSYIVADAHLLDDIPELQREYDLVVSRSCLQHMIDPLGTLEQVADKVAEGGFMAIGEIWGLSSRTAQNVATSSLLEAMGQAGFVSALGSEESVSAEIAAWRTSKESNVRFPLEFVDLTPPNINLVTPPWKYSAIDTAPSQAQAIETAIA